MFGTIIGSMIWFLVFLIAWLSLSWIGIAIVVGAIVITVLGIQSMLNDMEEKRKVK
jgi:ABC-type protease/lipase transport system fused ATPase/permease subunit